MRQPFQLKPLVIALSVLGATLPLYVLPKKRHNKQVILKVM